ncbi:hypothetical protein GTW71_08560 [Streptomyces sp. SID6041]|nr:hypothetical protein [Streptomyces sp. SID6041]
MMIRSPAGGPADPSLLGRATGTSNEAIEANEANDPNEANAQGQDTP